MNRYNNFATDQYMLSVLSDELTINEADNALTALTTLTSAYPQLFPFERTFARPDHDHTSDVRGPVGVRFIVYGEKGVERMIRLPRSVFATLKATIDEVFAVVSLLA